MDNKKFITLEIDSGKAEEFIAAIQKRSYIQILSMDLECRRSLGSCPSCNRAFGREVIYQIDRAMVTGLIDMVLQMKTYKTVVVVNDKNPPTKFSDINLKRSVSFNHDSLKWAQLFGLVGKFMDSTIETYYVSQKGLDFLSGKFAASPAYGITMDGLLMQLHGEMMITEVGIGSERVIETAIAFAKKAVARLPRETLDFVKSGQISLI